MAQNVKSSLVVVRLSTVSMAEALADETAKFLVCEEDSGWDTSADVQETPTKCGTFKVAGIPSNTLNGTGVIVGNLAANEVSAQQLKQWINDQTTVYMVYQNNADAGVGLTAGEATFMGTPTGGYFSSVGKTYNTGDGMGKFSWEYQVNGAPDLAP